MLDGNAIAGVLEEIFGQDRTAAAATCSGWGRSGPMAATAVYMRAPGIVVRCCHCDTVLAVVTERRATYCVDLTGIR